MKLRFTQKEIKDLFLAWILLSIAFAVLFSEGFESFFTFGFVILFLISALTAGIGFLFHELMHKYVAQRYGLFAEFQAFYKMIFLAIALAFFGFIIAAPGAVFIRGLITKEKNGKISVAGPVTNIILAVLFLIPILVLGNLDGVLGLFFSLGFRINALLAIFNMIPVMPFDGAKVIVWDKKVYWITVIIALGLFLLSWVV
jgi:Zn-dependent protease